MHVLIFSEVLCCVWLRNQENQNKYKLCQQDKSLHVRIYVKQIQANLYIKATQGNLKMCPLWAVAFYIQIRITCTAHFVNNGGIIDNHRLNFLFITIR